jgi:2-keto-myo-inositol isomerase
MKFLTCINHSTILTTPVEEAIKIADRAGFEGFDFQEKDLDGYVIIKKKDIKDLVNLFSSLKIKPFCFTGLHRYLPNFEFTTDEEYEKEIKNVIPLFEALEILGLKVAIKPEIGRPVVPSIEKVWSYKKCFKNAVKRNRQLAEIAKRYGIKIAFEFTGGSNFINCIERTKEVVKAVNHENFGYGLDTYHTYKANDKLEEYEEISGDYIFSVHFINVLDIPQNRISDFDRDYCLEGKLNLIPFLRLLERKGYNGYLTIELFGEKDWEQDPLKIANLAHKSLVDIIKIVS